MKKVFTGIICLALMLCLTACGGKEEPAEVIVTEAPTEAPTPEPTYVGMEEVLYGVWLPELPFSDWRGMNQDNIGWYELTTQNAYYDPNSDGEYANVSEYFKAYAMSLADYGYTVTEEDTDQYIAVSPDGRKMFLTYFGGGIAKISIKY